MTHFFPRARERASALSPPLGRAERLAVEAALESVRDPARLRLLRGVEGAARRLFAP